MSNDLQSQDFKWFVENYDSLYEKYGHSFLAIKNKTVLGAYSTCVEGVKETQKTETLGTFIVQECTGDQWGYTGYITSTYFL